MIHGLNYTTKQVENPKPGAAKVKSQLAAAPVPADAPKFFVDAMKRAQRLGRPVVIDFWADWCKPCKKLKKVTMQHADVAKVLDRMEVIYVDLDAHPSLAKAYGVTTIPDVFFVDSKGAIVDRLKKFEATAPFLRRLAKLEK